MSPSQSSPSGQVEQPERSRLVGLVGSVGYVAGVFGFAVGVGFVVMFVAMLALVLASGSVEAVDSLLEGEALVALYAVDTVVLGIGTALAAVLSFSFGWVPRRVVGFSIPTAREVGVGVAAVVGMLGLAVGISMVAEALGVPTAAHSYFDENATATYYVALAVLSILLVGPVEELLFRGLIQNYARPAFGSAGAVVLTSALFAAPHLPAYASEAPSTTAASLGLVFVVSLVLGAVYERHRNIVLLALIHGFYNAAQFGAQAVA